MDDPKINQEPDEAKAQGEAEAKNFGRGRTFINDPYANPYAVRIQKMKKPWGDMKRAIAEDIFIFSGVIIACLAYDHVANLLYSLGLRLTSQPYSIGIFQTGILVIFGSLLIRKINQWRYYS